MPCAQDIFVCVLVRVRFPRVCRPSIHPDHFSIDRLIELVENRRLYYATYCTTSCHNKKPFGNIGRDKKSQKSSENERKTQNCYKQELRHSTDWQLFHQHQQNNGPRPSAARCVFGGRCTYMYLYRQQWQRCHASLSVFSSLVFISYPPLWPSLRSFILIIS